MIVNGILFLKHGITVSGDSNRYLEYAEEIREQGMFFKPHEFWYIGYVLFILFVTSIYPSQGAIVIAQLLLSYLAVLSLHASARRLFGSEWIGLIVICLFLGFFMISFWNFWIYAESLFISLNCLSLFFLIKWVKNDINWPSIATGIVILLWTMSTKPTGVALLAALCALGIFFTFKMTASAVKITVIYTLIFFGFLMVLNSMLETFGIIDAYQTGEIVFNIRKLEHMEYAKWLMVSTPENLYLPDKTYPPLVQLVVLMVGNPSYTIELFTLKFFFFITGTRPYYSVWHNLFNVVILIPAYLLFGYSLYKHSVPPPLVWFSVVFVGVSVLCPTLLTIDWDRRFLFPMLPLIFLVGSGGGTIVNFFKSRIIKELN